MTARVYLETSVVSYLTARPSRDLVVAGHQQVTEDWWRTRKGDFELLVSPLVIQEAGRGDPEAVSRRMSLLVDIPVLSLTETAQQLAMEIVSEHLLPFKALADSLHIAIAAVHGVDYLLTWNCAHIANAELLPRVARLVERRGFPMPFVCTPEELLGVPREH